MNLNKQYEVQPSNSQRIALEQESMLNNAAAAARNLGQDITLIIERNGSGITAKLESGDIAAWAQIGRNGKVHASYSNQWGK